MPQVILQKTHWPSVIHVNKLTEVLRPQLRIDVLLNFLHTQTVRSERKTYTTVYTVETLLIKLCLAEEGKDRLRSQSVEEIYVYSVLLHCF